MDPDHQGEVSTGLISSPPRGRKAPTSGKKNPEVHLQGEEPAFIPHTQCLNKERKRLQQKQTEEGARRRGMPSPGHLETKHRKNDSEMRRTEMEQ